MLTRTSLGIQGQRQGFGLAKAKDELHGQGQAKDTVSSRTFQGLLPTQCFIVYCIVLYRPKIYTSSPLPYYVVRKHICYATFQNTPCYKVFKQAVHTSCSPQLAYLESLVRRLPCVVRWYLEISYSHALPYMWKFETTLPIGELFTTLDFLLVIVPLAVTQNERSKGSHFWRWYNKICTVRY